MNRSRWVADVRQFTLSTKLALGVTLLLAGISLFIYFHFPGRLEQQAELAIADKAESIAEAMAYAVSPAVIFEDSATVRSYLRDAGLNEDLVYIVVLDRDDEVFAAFRQYQANQLGYSESTSTSRVLQGDLVLGTMRPILFDGEEVGRLYLGMSLAAMHRQVADSRYAAALVSMFIFLAGLLGVFVISRLLTRRLGRIARTFDVISAGDWSKRAPVSGTDEVSDLARSFNTMVDRLESADEALREANVDLESRVARRTSELQRALYDHKQAAEELRVSEERFRAMFQSAAIGIALLDRNGRVLRSNTALRQALGCDEEGLRGRVLAEFAHEDDRPTIASLFRELVQGKRDHVEAEALCCRTDGSQLWSQVSISTLPSADGRTQFAIGMFDDVTERKRLESELAEAQKQALLRERGERERAEETAEKLAHYPRMNPNPVAEVTRDGKLSYLNESGLKLAEQVGASDPAGILPLGVENLVRDCLESGQWCSGFETMIAGVTLTWSFYPIVASDVVYAYGFDISEHLELEAQLREAQKLEAVGRLAGGVAHDFNNVLMAITGLSDMLLDDIRDGDPMREDLQEIQKAADRATSLTRQLLAFSRKQMLKPVELNLNAALSDIQKMVRRLIGEDVELITVLEPDLWLVEADPGQVEQVLMNLAVNARDAMPQGGTLTIETRNLELDRAAARQMEDVSPGSYVMLMVSDDGTGMKEETCKMVFEPFFTTKELGKGTGLGLSTCYGIIKQTGGSIRVESELGQGTTFSILLPKTEEVAKVPVQESADRPPLSGSETVLLVEDEPAVRDLASRVLRKKGYTVMEAAHGGEALEIISRLGKPVDLLVTDVVMPQVSGRELVEQVAVLCPDTEVIFMTGYTDDAIIHHGVLDSGIELIEKPFKPRVLLEKVREVLDAKAAMVRGAA